MRTLIRVEPQDPVQRAAQLERARVLLVLELEPQPGEQFVGGHARRTHDVRGDPFPRLGHQGGEGLHLGG